MRYGLLTLILVIFFSLPIQGGCSLPPEYFTTMDAVHSGAVLIVDDYLELVDKHVGEPAKTEKKIRCFLWLQLENEAWQFLSKYKGGN